jgi:dipeptidyl aminopeptidase/acylaminoacyl peptidase
MKAGWIPCGKDKGLSCPEENREISSLRKLLGLAALICATPALSRPVTPDDLYRIATVSSPRISPDGNWVAYGVSTPSREKDSDDDDLWMVSWDGRERIRLTSTPFSEHTPRWSPDGRRLAFLSSRADEDKGAQIWVMDREGGEAVQRSHFDGEISAYDWSPDGTKIVFAAEKNPPSADEKRPEPIVIDRLQFRLDEVGFLGKERTHLFVLDVAAGAVQPLTDGPYDEIQPAWSPDGKQIAFLSKRGKDPDAHDNWDVYLVGTTPGSAVRQLTTSPGMEGDPTWNWGDGTPRFSPDGKRITYLAGGAPEDAWYGLVQVGEMSVDGGPQSLPTAALDRNTIEPIWSPDGRWIYFRLEDNLVVQLARVRAGDTRVERLTSGDSVVSAFHVGPRNRAVVVSDDTQRPSELYAVENGKMRPLTQHNAAWLAEVDLLPARAFQFKSPDGLAVHGLLMNPGGEKPAAPMRALLRLHGGPVAQHQHEWDFAWQLFAANGYAVIAPNPRGSSGRGYEYQKKLFAQWGLVDVPDVLAAVDYAVAQGIADPRRLGVGGWSYGGMLTDYTIATDTRFKAAISGAGIANMFGSYGVDQYIRETEVEIGTPWKNTELWMKVSFPFFQADKIVTPTLFVCGEDDYNVPLVGSQQMYQALRRLGVPTQLVVYPEQAHSFDRPSFRVDRLKRYLEWYGKYL